MTGDGARSESSRLAVHRVRLPLVTPLGGSRWREVTLVGGPQGWGEFSPLPGYPAERAACWSAAVEAATRPWPRARCDRVRVNLLVPAVAPDLVADLLGDMDGANATAVKVKVGDAADVDRVAAVRAHLGPRASIRVDANGTWDLDTALDRLRRMARLGVELAEQPVAGLEELAALRRRTQVPVAADECVRSVDDALRLARLGAADALVVKVQPLGGVASATRVAEAAGVPAIVSSLFESSVGLAVGLALAAALPRVPFACGLGTGVLLAADVVGDRLVPVRGELVVRRPRPDPDLMARYGLDPS